MEVARVSDIILASVIGALGGWLLHHPKWCGRMERILLRLPFLSNP